MLIDNLPPLSSLGPQESGSAGAPALEGIIGDLTAAAASLVVEGLCQHWHGGRMDGRMRADIRRRGGEVIALLLEIREGTAGEVDFDSIARERGAKTLREHHGDAVSAETIDGLIDAVLKILHGVSKLRLN
jgi:hypothetical protein